MVKKTALVLSGGGARGAYEAGVIHYLYENVPDLHKKISIYTGASVGAINAVYLAATADKSGSQGKEVRDFWESVSPDRIFLTNFRIPVSFVYRYLKSAFQNRFSSRLISAPRFPGLLDVKPLPAHLRPIIPLKKIPENIRNKKLEQLVLVSTNLLTGAPELFIPRQCDPVYSGSDKVRYTSIGLKHILASAAIPLIFPPMNIGRNLYADGSMRMSTPLSPAVHLGAKKILIIDTLSAQALRKKENPISAGRSGISLVLGRILNSIFLDKLEADIKQTKRINSLLDAGEKVYGADFIPSLNSGLEKLSGDNPAKREISKIDYQIIRPSQTISGIYSRFEESVSPGWKNPFLKVMKGRAPDLLSYICFETDYLKMLTELGYNDAGKRKKNLLKFFDQA